MQISTIKNTKSELCSGAKTVVTEWNSYVATDCVSRPLQFMDQKLIIKGKNAISEMHTFPTTEVQQAVAFRPSQTPRHDFVLTEPWLLIARIRT